MRFASCYQGVRQLHSNAIGIIYCTRANISAQTGNVLGISNVPDVMLSFVSSFFPSPPSAVGLYCCLELDEYGKFERKARTTPTNADNVTLIATWDQVWMTSG